MSFAAFEYESVWKPGRGSSLAYAEFIKKVANEYGAQGWELVSFQVVHGDGVWFAFRRPVAGAPYR